MSVDPASGGSPRVARNSVMLSATVEQFGGAAPTKHRVRDLSAGGVKIDRAEELRPGSTVLVTVGALQSVGATVVWVKEGSAGLKFAHDIDPADARAKAIIPSRTGGGHGQQTVALAPTAGWIGDLNSPYRK